MNAMESVNGPWIAAAVLAVIVVAAVCAALLWRRSERRQARLIGRLRQDAAQQSEAVARLSEGLNAALRQIEAMSGAMELRQDRLRRTLDERMELMNQANEHRLEQMQALVTDKLDNKLSESFRTVNGQLEGVHRGLGEMRELATGVADLQRMLGGVKTRGVWGEVQLKALLEQLFAPGQVAQNAAIPEGSQTRVEFALRIPAGEGERLLPIDAKFPQEDYLRLVEASEAGDAEQARRCGMQLERAVMEQARRIHDKYIRPPQTTDFAVMFLPTESLYAEVARREDLIGRVQEKYRVLVSGPATLCALLTSVQLGIRSVTLERRSGEVLAMLSGMKQDFAGFDAAVQRMRQRLTQAEVELDALERQARKAVRALEVVEGEKYLDP
ncbi:MAG: DNA recombination protein RmuC [Clostridia bacterium]|nr:DNA recombination protein RmuC [Clostridia bacterium]